jgi:RNA-directed DNA polymerase
MRLCAANRGAVGVDGQTLEAFEKDLNLHRIWNRMSSGSYFTPPVRAVSIPKKSGDGERTLGVPTVGDRIAQMVVKQLIEPDLDPIFLPDSYGYRPRKSALDAIGVTIRGWLGHVSLDTTNIYAEIDLEMKAKALAKCELVPENKPGKRWRDQPALMDFLRRL